MMHIKEPLAKRMNRSSFDRFSVQIAGKVKNMTSDVYSNCSITTQFYGPIQHPQGDNLAADTGLEDPGEADGSGHTV